MKKRRCGNSEVQTIRGNASEERVIEIKVAHHHGFTVEFCIKEDPNEEAAQAHSVLFGIIQADRIPESFVVEDGEPKHGFFVDDVLNLWAEDGTNRKLQVHGECPDLCIEVGHPFRLTYRSEPFPHMLGELTNAAGGTCFTIDFDTGIPRGDYRPCVVFPGIGDGDFVMDASEKGMPDGEMFKLWTNRDFPDAEIVCQGKSFPVHRAVVALKSPVLAAAFGGGMLEATTSRLEVPHAKCGAVESFLRFLCTNTLPSSDALDVLPLAHCYQVEELIRRCGHELLRSLRPDTVVSTVVAVRAIREGGTMVAVRAIWDELLNCLRRDACLLTTLCDSVPDSVEV